jgi:hypothetical protein
LIEQVRRPSELGRVALLDNGFKSFASTAQLLSQRVQLGKRIGGKLRSRRREVPDHSKTGTQCGKRTPHKFGLCIEAVIEDDSRQPRYVATAQAHADQTNQIQGLCSKIIVEDQLIGFIGVWSFKAPAKLVGGEVGTKPQDGAQ